MKKILNSFILILLLMNFAKANNQIGHIHASESTITEKKKIKDIDSYKELERLLLKAYKSGDLSKSFSLAALYMEDYHFADGNSIKKNKTKAIFYLRKALNHGYGLAALPLMKEEFSKRNGFENTLLILEQGLKGKNTTLKEKVILSVTYNTLILDYKYEDIRYVHKALDLTYEVSQSTNKSTLDFTIANLLHLAGNYKEANMYLNTACNNPEVEAVVKESCNKSIGIKNNIEKSKTCKTCGVVK